MFVSLEWALYIYIAFHGGCHVSTVAQKGKMARVFLICHLTMTFYRLNTMYKSIKEPHQLTLDKRGVRYSVGGNLHPHH